VSTGDVKNVYINTCLQSYTNFGAYQVCKLQSNLSHYWSFVHRIILYGITKLNTIKQTLQFVFQSKEMCNRIGLNHLWVNPYHYLIMWSVRMLRKCCAILEMRLIRQQSNFLMGDIFLKTPQFQVEVFLILTSYSAEIGYQCFSAPCCLHHQGETMLSNHNSTRRRKPERLYLKHHRRESLKTRTS
jgi:hypothetical protein